MAVNLLTIKDIRLYLEKELAGIYNSTECAFLSRIVIKTISGPPGLHNIYDPSYRITDEQSSKITGIVRELKTGKPYQYVLGETEFFNCIIRVTPDVLIPRPETEELADLIIKENKDYTGRIIDFGTGSGCIAIALAKNLPDSMVTGIDNSEKALELAKINAALNNANVTFEKNDILDFNFKGEKAGIVVSNPPYVRNSEKALMNRNVLDFEPPRALFVDDSDPLLFYRKILGIAGEILLPGGKVYFEINEAMGNEMLELMASYGFSKTGIIRDLNNRDRIAKGIRK